MEPGRERRQRFRGRGMVLLGAVAFALALAASVRAYRLSVPSRVTMAPGNNEDLRYDLLLALAREAEAHRLHIDVVETSGSEDAIERVDDGTLDFAFVLGGLDFNHHPNVRQVAALHMAPLHLLVKEEIFDAVSKDLHALKGKTVNLGSGRGTLTYWLSREILAFAGLAPGDGDRPADYTAMGLTLAEMHAEQNRGRVPDALFFTGTLPEPAIRGLVVSHRYRLVPLEFRDAFALGAVTPPGRRAAPGAPRPRVVVQKERIYDAVIPAFTYQISPPVPPAPIHTLGVRVLLVTRRTMDSRVVGRILDSVFKTRFAKVMTPPLEPGLQDNNPEMPWHPGAVNYFLREQPLVTWEWLSHAGEVVSIFAPVLGGLLCVWQWFRQRSRFHSEQSFEMYIAKVNGIESQVTELELSPTLDPAVLLRLQRELSRIKTEALGRFARGEMDGAELMAGFLVHINDVRSQLNGMVEALRGELIRARVEAASADGPAVGEPVGLGVGLLPGEPPARGPGGA